MTKFKTAAEYAEKYEEYCKQSRDIQNSHGQLEYPSDLQQKLRFYAPYVSISLYDLIINLPILAQNGYRITHITFHHRKAWGDEEYIVFRYRDDKNNVHLRAPNTRKNLTRRFVSITREEAILIGFESETSREHMSAIDDNRRAFEQIIRPIAYQ
jgi:hypothetical protein